MIRSLLLALPLLAVGCATPTSGTYDIVIDSTSSDCPEGDDSGDDALTYTWDIEVSEAGDQVLIGGDQVCALDGTTFTCSTQESVDYAELGLGDAVVTIATDNTGTWTSNTRIVGSGGVATTCAGADCESLGIVACGTSTEWTGTLQE